MTDIIVESFDGRRMKITNPFLQVVVWVLLLPVFVVVGILLFIVMIPLFILGAFFSILGASFMGGFHKDEIREDNSKIIHPDRKRYFKHPRPHILASKKP